MIQEVLRLRIHPRARAVLRKQYLVNLITTHSNGAQGFLLSPWVMYDAVYAVPIHVSISCSTTGVVYRLCILTSCKSKPLSVRFYSQFRVAFTWNISFVLEVFWCGPFAPVFLDLPLRLVWYGDLVLNHHGRFVDVAT